jgi:hypothetical protein
MCEFVLGSLRMIGSDTPIAIVDMGCRDLRQSELPKPGMFKWLRNVGQAYTMR